MPPDDDDSSSRTVQNHQPRSPSSPPSQTTREASAVSFELQLRRAALRLGARVIGRLQMNVGKSDPSPATAKIGTATINENHTTAAVDFPISPSSPPSPSSPLSQSSPPPPPPPLPPSPFLSKQTEVIITVYCTYINTQRSPSANKFHWKWKPWELLPSNIKSLSDPNEKMLKKDGQVGRFLHLGCTIVIVHIIVMDTLYLNSMISHCIMKNSERRRCVCPTYLYK